MSASSPPVTLRRDLGALERARFDLVVIGGGISGACLAHDAALRGLSVALLERRDFGGATSAASSKVLHSGIRYLQQLRLDKARESAVERCRFQRIAPYLTRYVPFVIPTYRSLLKGRTALRAALLAHELVCAGQNALLPDVSKRVPRSRVCTKAETIAMAPILAEQAGLTGSCVLYEAHMYSSERMTLAFLKSAVRSGAVVANHLPVERLLASGGSAHGVVARDEVTGAPIEIRARVVVNAVGPWLSALNRAFGVKGLARTIAGFSKGVHLVTRALTEDVALVLPTLKPQAHVIDRGGRHVFIIPWRQRSLIGTGTAPFGDAPGDPDVTGQDVADLLAEINGALPGAGLTRADVQHAFAGLYPLTDRDVPPDVYQVTGSYQVVDHKAIGDLDGLVSVLGMKFTTARRVAERATDLIVRKLASRARPAATGTTPLVGGDIDNLPAFLAAAIGRHPHLDARTVQHLVEHYGTETDAVLATQTPGLQPTAPLAGERECIEAEIAFAVIHEMALHLDDVVLRRTGLGSIGHPGEACLRRCALIMSGLLDWSPVRVQEEIDRTHAALAIFDLSPRQPRDRA